TKHVGFFDLVAAKADELVERRFGIAHRAFGPARDGVKGRLVNFDFLLFSDERQMLDDEGGGDAPQVEPLAARKNCQEDFLRLGGCEHEFHMLGRLLKRFEQRVERFLGEHVDLVDNVYLKLGTGGHIFHRFAQAADFVDAAVARGINFQNVQRAAFGDFLAASVGIVEINFWAAGAVEAFGKDAGNGGLAGAARPAKVQGESQIGGITNHYRSIMAGRARLSSGRRSRNQTARSVWSAWSLLPLSNRATHPTAGASSTHSIRFARHDRPCHPSVQFAPYPPEICAGKQQCRIYQSSAPEGRAMQQNRAISHGRGALGTDAPYLRRHTPAIMTSTEKPEKPLVFRRRKGLR